MLVASKSSKTLAQAFRKVPTVGFAGSEVPLFESFLARLRELGWKPGEDVHVIHGRGAASLDVIDRLLDQQVDVLVAPSPVRLRYAAQRQTRRFRALHELE